MNINPSVTGINGSIDRTAAESKTTGSITESIQVSASSTNSIATFTNMEELKRAELRGEKHTVSDEQIVKAIESAIKAMQGKSTNLEFAVHEETKRIAVKVIDRESGEIIREIPPEKTLDFVAKLWEMAGILIDEKR
ncbi:flagellar protein FlaG [Paenibacillus arenilitoris]|uniref:Flagellar protein FlaG n=1 Tax=Paenibacillus arenilitoris TaxID=2772299 RepID=A0A927CLK0_9BACL|nr:flagellar protein FlaG [Paenibacillus arenilitoris]MBD2868416.1 flagellar protein FlaG [Paenibacillus arenilitoris]